MRASLDTGGVPSTTSSNILDLAPSHFQSAGTETQFNLYLKKNQQQQLKPVYPNFSVNIILQNNSFRQISKLYVWRGVHAVYLIPSPSAEPLLHPQETLADFIATTIISLFIKQSSFSKESFKKHFSQPAPKIRGSRRKDPSF